MNTFPGLVHTARHTTKVGNTRSRWPNRKEGAVEGGIRDWGEVVIELRPSLVTASTNLAICWKPRKYPVLLARSSERASGSENASGEADNQQGSRRRDWLVSSIDPSETTRRAPGKQVRAKMDEFPIAIQDEDMVRASWRHGE